LLYNSVVDVSLPDPPFYFPLRHGRYDVAPGLNRFGKDLGGGDADEQLFQIDRTFPRFRAAKLASRDEDFGKYVCASDLAHDTLADITNFIIRRLATEHPSLFRERRERDATHFYCALTNETLTFDRDLCLTSCGYTDALDALACQVQEDLAIVSTAPQEGRGHWLSAAHVCFPNGWAPGE
jgi:dimethylamine monooxygenase subunit A